MSTGAPPIAPDVEAAFARARQTLHPPPPPAFSDAERHQLGSIALNRAHGVTMAAQLSTLWQTTAPGLERERGELLIRIVYRPELGTRVVR